MKLPLKFYKLILTNLCNQSKDLMNSLLLIKSQKKKLNKNLNKKLIIIKKIYLLKKMEQQNYVLNLKKKKISQDGINKSLLNQK